MLVEKFADRIPLNHQAKRLMRGAWLQADGQLRKGRLWAVSDQAEVRYHFTDTKEGHNPARFLAKYAGKLLPHGGPEGIFARRPDRLLNP